MAARTTRRSDGIVDLVAVDRVVDNLRYAPLNVEERAVAASRLSARGHGVGVISRILRCSTDNVRDALRREELRALPRAAVTYDVGPAGG